MAEHAMARARLLRLARRGTDDKALIDVQGVPLEHAAAVFEALGKALG